jgi:recombination protein RecA
MKVAGGHALAHGKLLDIHIEQGARIKHVVGKEQKIIGKEINWEIMKAKAGSHDGPKGTYKFYTGEMGITFGVDVYSDLVSAGLQAGIVQQQGAWFSYNGSHLGQGIDNVGKTLYNDPVLLQTIRKEIFKAAGLHFITRENV